MLNYTGHPLVDVGVVTITAFANKDDPTQLTEADLEAVADYMAREYVKQPLRSFLTVAFTSNAWFIQDAYNPNKPGLSAQEREQRRQKREKWAKHHLWQWTSKGDETSLERDVFTGELPISVELSGKLPPGKAGRAQIPLAFGDEYINFYPNGFSGLPISGKTLLCLQAFPLGCAKCGGRLLAVHSDNPNIMLHFAETFLNQNRRAVQLAQMAGSDKLPEAQYNYRTLLIDTLLPARVMQNYAKQEEVSFSITAYHFTNSGQGVDLNIYYLPLEMVGFLADMESAEYHQEWHALVRRAWEVAPKKKAKQEAEPFQPRRNWLYEDLFDLPANAARFIRTYFLRVALRYAKNVDTDPRDSYSTQTEAELVSWKITAKFLWRILHMEKERIEHIRSMGDTLAQYVNSQNDRRFFREFFTMQRYDYFRNLLLKANLAQAKRGNAPMIGFDAYISVFEEGEDLARPDWRLARDLVLIRMVEQLHQSGWLGKNVEAIPETVEEGEAESVGQG